MNWEAIGAIGEVLGALAVVVTLVYFARQLGDTSKQISLMSLANALQLWADAFQPIYNDERNQRIFIKGQSSPEALDEFDREVFFLFMTRLMATFDAVVEQHELGAVPDDRFEQNREFARQFLNSPGGQAWTSRRIFRFTDRARISLGIDEN